MIILLAVIRNLIFAQQDSIKPHGHMLWYYTLYVV